MWTRSLLKKNAWNSLKEKGYYWTAFGVCFLTGLLGADGDSTSSSFSVPSSSTEELENLIGTGSMNEEEIGFLIGMMVVVLLIAVFAMAIGFAYYAFVGGPFAVGRCNYFYKARNDEGTFTNIFDNFSSGKYLSTVKVMFFKMLYTWLWSLLLVIPGIVKSYEYYLIPYLMAENPHLSKERAFEISKRAMNGEKWNLFILELSFIGWELLGLLACCVGIYFVVPYEQATFAEFYACMRAKILAQGISTEEELTGGMGGGMVSGQITSAQNPYDM